MSSLFVKKDRLSFYFIILLAVAACKKEGSVDDQNENLQAVQFKISGFTSESIVLKSSSPPIGTQSANPVSNYVEGYLYFWSFNDSSLVPDIAYQDENVPSITYLKGTGTDEKTPNSVGSGAKYLDYAAGRAISCDGPSEILVKIPIQGADQITEFGFHAGSSTTGPKDFELYYSVDEGETYEILQVENQFGETKSTAWNDYNYQLSDKNITGSYLWFKFLPKEGIRGEGSAYNSTSGTLRFDNIRLVGMSSSSGGGGAINKLHYYLFHKTKPEVVVTGTIDYEEASSLKLNVPEGKYSICFVSNTSNRDLILPSNPTLSNFYVGNYFSNANADIFGYYGELEVNGETDHEVKLRRLFSQIKLEFTDASDLSVISKIRISQQHESFFFAPFLSNMTNPILDQSDVEVVGDFQQNKQLVFNQFMGEQTLAVPIKYSISLLGTNGVLRTFQLQSTLKQNMQLVFRGNLLVDVDPIGTFQIRRDMDWDGDQEATF
ncbi:hypothetical protein [Sphingobacterium faecale]|uniref:DUF5017 domain-containing protein n=1 Tax=Sphingobacterium faecale TaxID=2803775 RepID=A0ABS1R7C6_9SPHI|nr:hypothetical protein [Sphingobacterium faecale]MBL1410603.1 hypothetical protein [Sphingobacterium faecale]